MTDQSEPEIWKPVLKFEDRYEVSNLGRVRAIFEGNSGGYVVGRILKPVKLRGYLRVRLYTKEMKVVHKMIHSTALESFVSPRPLGKITRHLDGNKTNNLLSNLKWGTNAENSGDMVKHGTSMKGEKNNIAILTEDDIRGIRKMRAKGFVYKVIGRIFNTHWSNVWLICKGKHWKHVPDL